MFSGRGIAIETAGGPSHLTDTGRGHAGSCLSTSAICFWAVGRHLCWGGRAGPNLRLLSAADPRVETGSGAAGRRSETGGPRARPVRAESAIMSRPGPETPRRLFLSASEALCPSGVVRPSKCLVSRTERRRRVMRSERRRSC